MPITENIMKNPYVAPWIRQGIEKGLAKGRAEGRAEGLAEGQLRILLGQISKRFGRVPVAVRQRLAAMNSKELAAAGLRLLDAKRIDDLFSA
jgi:flagellar biosynthesis/type III secretory pathway protein FliH